MPNHFWPQDFQSQSDQKISKPTRKRLYIPVCGGHSGSLGRVKSKKICILTKSCSIESSSKRKKKKMPFAVANHHWKPAEASGCCRLCPSGKICHRPSAVNSETLCLISFTQVLSASAEWQFPAYKATCPCSQDPLILSHRNAEQLTASFLKMNSAANGTETI